jgi:hypothetical protein
MKYFAKLGVVTSTGNVIGNKVNAVINVNDDVLLDSDGNENESLGIEFLTNLYGYSNWVQCSKETGGLRKNSAGVGMVYDGDRDAFISQQPFPSWVLDEDTCRWEPPTPRPLDGTYGWNEDSESWDEILI